MENYSIYQDRRLYQLFPDKESHVGFALPVDYRYSKNNDKLVWDRYTEYYNEGRISYIGDLIENGATYKDIMEQLDLV